MKKKQATKMTRTAAVSAAFAMAMLLAAGPAAAATDAQAVVDGSRTGTLVIHKIVENSGTLSNADGLRTAASATPVDNIGFDPVRIAELKTLSGVLVDSAGNADLVHGDGTASVGTYYVALPQAGGSDETLLESLFMAAGVTPEKLYLKPSLASPASGVQTVYSTEALESAMQAVLTTLGEDRINRWVKAHAAEQTANANATMGIRAGGYTDSNGEVTFSDLPLGLYIVAETDYSAHDGRAGAWDDAVSGQVNHDPNNTYDAAGYHIWTSDGWGTATVHDYQGGEYYRESRNPEAPVIETPAAPFLVSLPSTNTADTTGKAAAGDNAGTAGSVWQYTMDVYPKNQTTAIYKRIIDPDERDGAETLRTSEDFQIGDTIEQIIWADAPVLQKNYLYDADDAGFGGGVAGDLADRQDAGNSVNQHLGYVISDTMTKGLSFAGVTEVLLLPKEAFGSAGVPVSDDAFRSAADGGQALVLQPGEDYTVVNTNEESVDLTDSAGTVRTVVEKITGDAQHGFAVVLTAGGLEKLNACTEDSAVAVRFHAILNKAATIGQVAQNMNYPTLNWVNSNTSFRSVNGNEVYDYTYELQLRKTGVADGNRVKFVISRKDHGIADGDYLQAAGKDLTDTVSAQTAAGADGSMKFVKEADGIYHVWGYSTGITAGEGDAADACETTTVNGTLYNTVTPKSDGSLVIKGLDSNDYVFKEILTEEENNLLAAGFTVSLRAPDNQASDPDSSLRDGHLITASVSSADGEAVPVTIGAAGVTSGQDVSSAVAVNQGIASFHVQNFDAIDLRTGGPGTILFYLTGSVLAAGVGIGLLVNRRKRREQ